MGDQLPEEIALEFVRCADSRELDSLADFLYKSQTLIDVEGGVGEGGGVMMNGRLQ